MDLHSDHSRGNYMENQNKNRGKGGKKKVETAAADEQPQREKARSHALKVARKAIFEFGIGLNRPVGVEGLPSDQQAGPSHARPSRDTSEEGEKRSRSPSPASRKKRREERRAAGMVLTEDDFEDMSEFLAETTTLHPRPVPRTSRQLLHPQITEVQRHLRGGLRALRIIGEMSVPVPGKQGKYGCLRNQESSKIPFQQLGDRLRALHGLAEESVAAERIRDLEEINGSLRKELAKVRLELMRAKKASDDSRPVPAPPAPPPGGRSATRSASKGAQREEWVTVGKGGKARREVGQRVQLVGGVVNPPPGVGAAANKRQGGHASRGAPKGQGGNATGGAPKRQGAAAALQQQPKRVERPKLPRNPAVLLTAVGERSYASLLKEARESVDLKDIGIDLDDPKGGLHMKRARNGGYLFEVPGKDGAAKADRLARELGEVLVGGAKIARPVKTAEVRVTGLVDGVTPDEVVAAFMKRGECSRDDLAAGEIRRSPGGLGALWLRCPLAAALKVVAGGGLRLGWARARVQLLEVRPLQCYRCLKFGHLAAACKSGQDRKGCCFRCGGAGHVAKGCVAQVRCPLCDKAGGESGHRMGGRACPAARAAWAKKGGLPVYRPEGTQGRSRGGKAKNGRSAPAPAGGAVGPDATFRVPEHPAPRRERKEGGDDARAPRALERAEPSPMEEGEAGDVTIEDIPCSQPPSVYTQMETAGEEEETASCLSTLLEGGIGEWVDSPPLGRE